MTLLESLWVNKWTILFYGAIILLLYIYRNKFDRQGRFIFLYRTKLGLKLMDSMAQKAGSFIRFLGYVGVGVGYLGMLTIVVFVFYGLYQLAFVPEAPPTISPVIPGVAIPGSPIKVPLIVGWIALFISAAIHEFSHGVVSRAHGFKVNSSGFAFIGPLAAAFVEPDEKQLQKSTGARQNSVYAAGPFSNLLLGIVMFFVLGLAIYPLLNIYLVPQGFGFEQVPEGYSAFSAGIEPDVRYDIVNGEDVESHVDFFNMIDNVTPNQTFTISTSGSSDPPITLTTGVHPDDPEKGYFGVVNAYTFFENENSVLAIILLWIKDLFNWIFIITIGLGLANLLPIGPVDGGRLFQTASFRIFGKKKGKKVWGYVTLIFIGLLILLFIPIIREIIKSIVNLFIPGVFS